MSVNTLRPSGDGTLGSWTRNPASGTWASQIDEGVSGQDNNTTYVQGPNVADGSMFVLLDDVTAGFDPNAITAITISYAAVKVEGGVSQSTDTVALHLQVFRSDETTAITTETAAQNITNTNTAAYTTGSPTVSVSGTHTVSDWNGARLRIRQDYTVQQMADTTAQLRVSAVEVVVTFTLEGSVTESATATDTPAATLTRVASLTEAGNATDAPGYRPEGGFSATAFWLGLGAVDETPSAGPHIGSLMLMGMGR